MKLIFATLTKFERMELNDINSFTIRPTELIQLILGTNGSGKSSLLRELTWLPSEKNAYRKEGGKVIEGEHRGHIYRTESFPWSGKHYFYKDGENLNPGGTAAVMKEMVKKELGLTPEIWKLYSGIERFTSMSPSRRREWMTMLADSDYNYAIRLYDRLRTRARDTTGALRRAKEDLVTEKNKIISKQEEDKLRNEVNQLHRELNILMENRAPLDFPVSHYETKQERLMEELKETSDRLLRLRIAHPLGRHPLKPMERNDWGEMERPHFNNVEEVTEVIDYLKGNIISTETLLNTAVKLHDKHQKAYDLLQKTGAQGIEALRTKKDEAAGRRMDILTKRKLKLEGINGPLGFSAMQSTYDSLVEIFTQIPINEERKYSQAAGELLQQTIYNYGEERKRIQGEINRKMVAKTHMESHKTSGDRVCPKCAHVWVEGYNPEKYDALLKDIEALEAMVIKFDGQIRETEEAIDQNRLYGNYYRSFIQITRNWPVLEPFWNYLIENEYVVKNPRFALSVMETFRYDLEQEVAAAKVSNEINELIGLIAAAEQLGDTSLIEVQNQLDETQANIDEYTAILVDLRKRLADYTEYRGQLQEAFALDEKVTTLRKHAWEATEEMVEMLRRESIQQCIRQLQSQLGRKEDVLTHIEIQRGIVEHLENDLIRLEKEEEVVKHMVREISPTEGIIAEGLLGFIKIFTNQMNSILKKVWSYPLMVMPCGTGGHEGAELDYYFPVMVNTRKSIRSDVSEGSTGIREIIDVAFKIVAMEYLGMEDWPLMLDEFGSSLDEEHRKSSGQAIKQLMEIKSFPQLFMVSHYHEQYGSLNNPEVCVLCFTNITIPKSMVVNKHVEIH